MCRLMAWFRASPFHMRDMSRNKCRRNMCLTAALTIFTVCPITRTCYRYVAETNGTLRFHPRFRSFSFRVPSSVLSPYKYYTVS